MQPLALLVLERSLRQHGPETLEDAIRSLPPERLDELFAARPEVLEAGILRTCHRLDIMLILRPVKGVPHLDDVFGGGWTVRVDREAARHLARVAFGLESSAVGEREVAAQVGRAMSTVRSRHRRSLLRRMLRGLADAPLEHPIPASERRSIAEIAANWVSAQIPRGSVVVVLGSGGLGRDLARRVGSQHRVIIVRSRPGGGPSEPSPEVLPRSHLDSALDGAQALVCATKSPGPVVERRQIERLRPGGPMVFVDLGMPRNLDPTLAELPGVVVADLTTLSAPPASAEIADLLTRGAGLAATQLLDELEREGEVLAEDGFWRQAEQLRREEWVEALRHVGSLDPAVLAVFERMSERLVRRVCAGPARDLRDQPPSAPRPDKKAAWEIPAPWPEEP